MNLTLRRKVSLPNNILASKVKQNDEGATVSEMRKALDLNTIQPVSITENDAYDMQDDQDYFKGWYEDELRKLFNEK
ncbi:hypothetical protein [Paenibacillus sp. QZ-Y1]|uniref:hypothetical protein n=1 Tax=Paenibacillus sp. QZ-Y1 TaxID=3414511 RepID=UPI003F795B31